MADNRKTLEKVNKKWVRVLTVITYVIAISMIALILGLYYRLVWHPNYNSEENQEFKKNIDQGPGLNQTIYLGHVKVVGATELIEQVIAVLEFFFFN